jgi:hypothetical protein
MWRMLDGWLPQWECALYLLRQGGVIPENLNGFFPIARREA